MPVGPIHNGVHPGWFQNDKKSGFSESLIPLLHIQKNQTSTKPAVRLSDRKIGGLQRKSKVLAEQLERCLSPLMRDELVMSLAEPERLRLAHELQSVPLNIANASTLDAVMSLSTSQLDPANKLSKGTLKDLEASGVKYQSTPVEVSFDRDNLNHNALVAIQEAINIIETLDHQSGRSYGFETLKILKTIRWQIMNTEWPNYFNNLTFSNLCLVKDGQPVWRADLALYPPEVTLESKSKTGLIDRLTAVKPGLPQATEMLWNSLNQSLLEGSWQALPDELKGRDITERALYYSDVLSSNDFDDEQTITRALGRIKKGAEDSGVKYDGKEQLTEYNPEDITHVLLVKLHTLKSLNGAIRDISGQSGNIDYENKLQLNEKLGLMDEKANRLMHQLAASSWPERFDRSNFALQTLVHEDQPVWCSAACYPRSSSYLENDKAIKEE